MMPMRAHPPVADARRRRGAGEMWGQLPSVPGGHGSTISALHVTIGTLATPKHPSLPLAPLDFQDKRSSAMARSLSGVQHSANGHFWRVAVVASFVLHAATLSLLLRSSTRPPAATGHDGEVRHGWARSRARQGRGHCPAAAAAGAAATLAPPASGVPPLALPAKQAALPRQWDHVALRKLQAVRLVQLPA